MNEIYAKTILQPVKKSASFVGWFGPDYNMNLYKGCNHGCIYCDSRSDCYHVENFDEVRYKKDALKILDRELAYKKKGVVSLGAMSDHYNPFEMKYEYTRQALKLIEFHGYGLSFETKSALVVRDKDIFLNIHKKHNLILKMTITTADDELCRKIEPHVSVTSERFKAIQELSAAGLFVGVLLTPLLPFINDTEENIEYIIRRSYEAGAKFVYMQPGVTLRSNQRDYFYDQLDRLFPTLKEKYIRVYRDQYMCNSLQAKKLIAHHETLCKKYGLLYKMKDIIQAYKRPIGYIQESLF